MDPVTASIIAGASLGSAGIGVIGANASTKKQYKYQSKLQAQAAQLNYDYSIKAAQNLHSATREGLENAGYNPMLAVQNGTSGSNSSYTSSGQASAPDYNAGISAGIANAQSFQRLENETQVADSTTDKNIADADESKARKLEILERLPWVSKKMKAEIGQLEAEAQLAEAKKHNLKERLSLDRDVAIMQNETTKRGQDKAYNASTFSSTLAHPFSRFAHKTYKSGSGPSGKSRDGRTAREIVGW